MVKLLLCIPGSITSTFAKASPIFPYPPLHRAGCGLQQWCAESQDHFSYVCLMMLVRRELCGHRQRCHVMARTRAAVVSPKYWSLSIRNFLYVFPSLYMLHSGGDSGHSVRMKIYIFFPFCCYPTSQCATVKLCQAEISSKKC